MTHPIAAAPQLLPACTVLRPIRFKRDLGDVARLWHGTQHEVYADRRDILDLRATRAYLESVMLPLHQVLQHQGVRHGVLGWQRKGIGRALLNQVKAQSEGCLVLACRSAKAGAFYLAQGFHEVGSSSASDWSIQYEWLRQAR